MDNMSVVYFLWSPKRESDKWILETHGKYINNSILSLKKYVNFPCILYSNIPNIKDVNVDEVRYRDFYNDVWTYKYDSLLETQSEKVLHLDCDTYACGNFTDIFRLLDKFDFVIPLSSWHINTRWEASIPKSFPELAGGLMLYRNNEKVRKLLEYTRELILNRRGGCDEPYLRKALYESDIRFAIIPLEYNCVFNRPGFLVDEVVVLHGKYTDLDRELKAINSLVGPRLLTGDRIIKLKRIPGRKYVSDGEITNGWG